MRVLITGATGTIGLALADALTARGDQVVALSRDPERGQRVLGDGVGGARVAGPRGAPPPAEALAGVDAVVNLLGEPVAQRWTDDAKQRIRESRVQGTRAVVSALKELPPDDRPRALISQSATGYYGPRGDAPLDEQASPGDDFLAEVTVAWEREACSAESTMRVVLHPHRRGAVPQRRSAGQDAPVLQARDRRPGRRRASQYVPWIHLDDVVGGAAALPGPRGAAGPVNLTAPNPVTNAELSRALGHALGRPAVLPVPGLAIKLLYGEMAEIVTTGQRAIPARLGSSATSSATRASSRRSRTS